MRIYNLFCNVLYLCRRSNEFFHLHVQKNANFLYKLIETDFGILKFKVLEKALKVKMMKVFYFGSLHLMLIEVHWFLL